MKSLGGFPLVEGKDLRFSETEKLQRRFWNSVVSPLAYSTRRYVAQFGNLCGASDGVNDLVCVSVHKHKYRTLNHTKASKLDFNLFRILNMTKTTSERVALMMSELKVDQPGFGKIAGASKSVVNQWLSGLIKKIGPKYAYAIEANTRYRKEWVMFGDGDKYKFTIEGESRRIDVFTKENSIFVLTPPPKTGMEELTELASQLDTLRMGMLIKTARDLLAEMPAKQTPESTG